MFLPKSMDNLSQHALICKQMMDLMTSSDKCFREPDEPG